MTEPKKIYLVGIGMGTQAGLTEEARKVIASSDVIAGAKRMLAAVFSPEEIQESPKEKVLFDSYSPKKIAEFFKSQTQMQQGAVLLSGDVGFYSGAKGLLKELEDFQVSLVPGISSVVYFCSRLKLSWEDVCLSSVHGRQCNLIGRIRKNHKTFALLDQPETLKKLCDKLIYYGMGEVILHIGERLSYPEEHIISKRADELQQEDMSSFDKLLVVLAENPAPKNQVAISIPEEEFIRGKVPMTKSEVRTVSIGKMHLTPEDVCYDIGAGSGSISVEMAVQSEDIKVYSIEKKPEALEILQQNKRKFAVDNMEIIPGMAPEVLEELPPPSVAFIGGSDGKIGAIIDKLLEKNPACRIVINTVTLNTISEIMDYIKQKPELATDIVQMQVAKDKKLGQYHMMMAQNPIYIITLTATSGKEEE